MLHAHFTTSEGAFTVQFFEAEAPNTVANFVGLAEGTKEWTDPRSRQEGEAAVLRRADLPPRHRRIHDPGRRSARHRHRRARLQVRRRVPSQAAPQQGRACCRWPTPGPAPTAASSSSRSRRRRGSTTSTASSAKSSKAWTSWRRSAARRRASPATGRSSRSRLNRSRFFGRNRFKRECAGNGLEAVPVGRPQGRPLRFELRATESLRLPPGRLPGRRLP